MSGGLIFGVHGDGESISTIPKKIIRATILVLTLLQCSGAANDRETVVSQRIYEKITDSYACFRRMNGTHQFGCSSKQGGSVGVLHLIEKESDVDWIVKTGPHSPYIALLHMKWFNPEVLEEFQNSLGRVSGVVLLARNESSEEDIVEYTPDKQCPNRGYGFYTNASYANFCPKWNSPGNEILFRDWNFPIFYATSDTAKDYLLDCYRKYNQPHADGTPRDWPLCAAELLSFMSGAVDTPTCIRRNKLSEVSVSPNIVCDPLGDANVWSTLVPRSQAQPYKKRSVVIIAARLDASSMFDQISPGADTAATGITAVLALAKQLAPLKDHLQTSANISNVYFILFNGEAFDYIGSSRIVYDMANDNFPYKVDPDKSSNFPASLHLEDVLYYIEFNQLSLSSPRDSYYIHRNWNSSAFDEDFQNLYNKFSKLRQSTKIVVANDTGMGVPPSSLQSFLAQNPDFPGIVFTNHHKEFKNKHYNSILDDLHNIHYSDVTSLTVNGIAELVATVANSIEELIVGSRPPFFNNTANPALVNDILECYVKNPGCQLFQTVTNDDANELSKLPKSFYVSVNRRINALTTITHHIMGYHQGNLSSRAKENCHRGEQDSKIYEYIWINGSCYQTTATVTPAVSPAFDDVDNYDWKSGRFSTWSESVWSDLRVRIFLKVSPTQELLTLVSGIIVFLLSIVLFSWINNNADTIFQTRVANRVC